MKYYYEWLSTPHLLTERMTDLRHAGATDFQWENFPGDGYLLIYWL